MTSYFSCGVRRGQFNLGNTVLVNLTRADEYLLGYLQDINADQVFIDFDSERIAPQWVPMQRVWHHDKPSLIAELPCDVHVAVRREAGGPYIFGPAKLLCSCSSYDQFLCCVSLEHASSTSEKPSIRIVHSWQLIHRLPSNWRPDRICRLPIKKVVYGSDQPHSIRDIQERHIERILDVGFRHGNRPRDQGRDRVFVRVTAKKFMFLIMRIQCCCPSSKTRECLQSSCWLTSTTRKVAAGIEHCLYNLSRRLNQTHMLNLCYGQRQPVIRVLPPPSAGKKELALFNLLPEILSIVICYLDIVSQGKLKRVCSVWNAVICDRAFSTCITIDFSTLSRQILRRAETEGYHIALLLHRFVNAKTKTLALINMDYRTECNNPVISLVANWLIIARIILPLIIVKNCRITIVKAPYGIYTDYTLGLARSEQRKIDFRPLQLKQACRRVVVLNAEINCGAWTGVVFPHRARKRIKLKEWTNLIISVPKLQFRQSQSDADVIMQLKHALERNCYGVTPFVKNRIKAVHAGWVRQYPYHGTYPANECFGAYSTASGVEFCNDSDHQDYAEFFRGLDLRDFEKLPMGNIVYTILACGHLRLFRRINGYHPPLLIF
ncbi:uncharacterized protein LOC129596873 isoform X2 [Paramacrobiotus metropolitanus]|uniref:uncharacterized protein LOC129596873 isoform X2 n=1 Tax=Paramacrobiotus metropolitanus TaxID=2943436 RepID=UPI0024457593|nr:uncharacterized protein LOC129596873 isoform X2 [Paramacrobiotus metropolitanus]